MDSIEEAKPVEIVDEKPAISDKSLEERVAALEVKVAQIEPKITEVQETVTPVKQTLQVVIEKEGDVVKVRRKVLVTIAGNSKEQWEDATEEVDTKVKEDLINGN